MKTYIRQNIRGYYIEFDDVIDSQYWEGKTGTTWQDFLDGKWVMLSDEQVAFHKSHPEANVKEVLDMQITPAPERTVEQAKAEKMSAIDTYDSGEAVNSFDIMLAEGTVTAWLTPDQRANYKNSLDSAELLGLTEVHPVFDGIQIALSVQVAKTALARLQVYADRCFIVTEQHKADVEALSTIEAVDGYDHTAGYPQRLVFNLTQEGGV